MRTPTRAQTVTVLAVLLPLVSPLLVVFAKPRHMGTAEGSAMSPAEPLEMACPVCGQIAGWAWTRTSTDSTAYTDIVCARCGPVVNLQPPGPAQLPVVYDQIIDG